MRAPVPRCGPRAPSRPLISFPSSYQPLRATNWTSPNTSEYRFTEYSNLSDGWVFEGARCSSPPPDTSKYPASLLVFEYKQVLGAQNSQLISREKKFRTKNSNCEFWARRNWPATLNVKPLVHFKVYFCINNRFECLTTPHWAQSFYEEPNRAKLGLTSNQGRKIWQIFKKI